MGKVNLRYLPPGIGEKGMRVDFMSHNRSLRPGGIMEFPRSNIIGSWDDVFNKTIKILEGINMPKVMMEGKDDSRDIRLNNGDVIVVCFGHYTKFYMVSSFGQENVEYMRLPKRAQEYCAMIDLSTGGRVIPMPSERKTTMKDLICYFHPLGVPSVGGIMTITITKCDNYTIIIKEGEK